MALSGHRQKRKEAPEVIEQPVAKKAKRSKTAKHITGQDHDRKLQPTSHKKKKNKEFRMIRAQMTMNIPAVYTGPGRPRQAVLEMLDSILMQYVPSLQGVLLAHSNLEFASQTANFLVDSPFAKVDVNFQATVWSPAVGSKLWGEMAICSPDHIGLLIHKTFNASIPRHHIPDEWEFEYGSLENDPEYGAAAEEDGGQREEGEDRGRWVRKATGEMIDGGARRLEFTIVGFNIADAMLSLIGSLQPDPFSPDHQPKPATSHFTSGINRRKSKHSIAEEDSVAGALMMDNTGTEGTEEPFSKEERSSDGEVEEGSEDEVAGGGAVGNIFENIDGEAEEIPQEPARGAKIKRQKVDDEAKRQATREERRERKRKRREERRLNGEVNVNDDRHAKKKKRKDKTA